MRILMLGWEFPPFIAGGLGTACHGLTRALDQMGHEVTFVLPRAVDRSHASHVQLLSPEAAQESAPVTGREAVRAWSALQRAIGREEAAEMPADLKAELGITEYASEEFERVRFASIPAMFSSPYGDFTGLTEQEIRTIEAHRRLIEQHGAAAEMPAKAGAGPAEAVSGGVGDAATEPTKGFLQLANRSGGDYSGDMMQDVQRYAALCLALTRGRAFDVIHAHDWMTFPAGMAVARMSGRPLVVHVHSTEFDRSGLHVNQQIYDIERRGMHSAIRVITVSHLTRTIVIHRYGVDERKIRVIWNGVDQSARDKSTNTIETDDRIVLFLGRITMQKGPEYFVAAAKRVLEKVENVKFIVAGSGDMATRMIELAAEMGIGHKVLFTGFLRGRDVDRVFSMADCYVMPSVSEPFGIAPLEAISHDVPTIISKQSGVSEALTHVLKVDFWDIDEMANKIVAVLKYPPLGQTLRQHGRMELRTLTWEGAASKCVATYEEAAHAMEHLFAGVR